MTQKSWLKLKSSRHTKKRLELLETKYWSHSKRTRKDYNLREELGNYPIRFSGQFLLRTAHEAIIDAEKKRYPIDLETYLEEKQGDLVVHNFQQLANWLNINLNYMDEKIYRAEAKMIENGDFNPSIRFKENDEETTVEMMAKAIITARDR